MKYIYGIYSSLLKEVQDLADSVNQSMREFTGEQGELLIGWKVCEYTVTAQTVLSKAQQDKITAIVKEHFDKRIKGKRFWIKLERTEK